MPTRKDPFASKLIEWHRENPRMLPWTDGPRDPYHIWISEIIMQQTRINQGSAYYHSFIDRFPDVFTLADAPVEDVLHAWQGLGYYSRARNIHKAANQIVTRYNGRLPDDYESLLKLSGVGNYTAAAIASFGYSLPHAVVDGNVKRLISRYHGITDSVDKPEVHRKIQALADSSLIGSDPAEFNQAIMNFGALVCKPAQPLCGSCPLSSRCYAYQHELTHAIPAKSKKGSLRKRYFWFFVFTYKDKLAFVPRESKDIWHQLHTFPIIETDSDTPLKSAHKNRFTASIVGHANYKIGRATYPVKQLLSHQELSVRFIPVELLSKPLKSSMEIQWLDPIARAKVGKPKLIVDYLKTLS